MSKEDYFVQAELRENCLSDWEVGVAIRMTPAHGRHGLFIGRLFSRLDTYIEEHRNGCVLQELFVDFGTRVYGVDLAVLLASNVDLYQDGRIKGSPYIIVEVLSDDSVVRDRTDKMQAYWDQHVPWYWVGDPLNATLEEYKWTADGYALVSRGDLQSKFTSQALPGFSVELGPLVNLPSSQSDERPSEG